MKEYKATQKKDDEITKADSKTQIVCPECGSTQLSVQGRCVTCLSCAFSVCSV